MDKVREGQRWISDTEAELGLGLVTRVEARFVEVRYRASGVTRVYAREAAPLTRVRLAVGDRVASPAGEDWRVAEVRETDGLLVYRCVDPVGDTRLLPEQQLDDGLQLHRPQDRLLAARIDPDAWFSLRYQSWRLQATERQSLVHGLLGARIGLIPHQLYVASEVASRYAPRVLLADEVGLGKTVEAGLILHKLLRDGQVSRVLLLLPESLMHQWLVEMLRRFNLGFSLFDQQRLDASSSDNPFEDEQLLLCSLDLLLSNPRNAKLALEADWDLLLVDEAHHLQWSEQRVEPGYALVEALARRIRCVLLLTATPEQLGRAGHFGRLRLLDPQRFPDYRSFLAEERDYAAVAAVAGKLLAREPLDTGEQELLHRLLGEEAQADPARSLQALLDRHGTGRVMFRNRRQGIAGFPGRVLRLSLLPLPGQYASLPRGTALLTPESVYGPGWTAFDPRVGWLIDLLRRLAGEKLVLICAHAQTVIDLRDHLLSRHGIHAAMFHEGMPLMERDRAAAFFADPEEGTPLLLCSEIGSEGRNFQFARHLVLFDLPLDADLLEQRIGRLDRIGQRQRIQIHLPVFRDSPGELLFRWYHQVLNAFEQSCQTGGALFARLGEPLLAAMDDPGCWDSLLDSAQRENQALVEAVEAGRDRLLELHSHDARVSALLVEQIRASEAQAEVETYIRHYWDLFGVEQEPGPGTSTVLRPGRHMLSERFPGLPESGLTLTFDRDEALTHEDWTFLTREHPMLRSAMDYLLGSERGATALTVIRHPDFTTGSLLLELLYVLECPAPRELGIGRFLPQQLIRLLLDADGVDRSRDYPHAELTGVCLSHKPEVVAALIRSRSQWIQHSLAVAEQLVERRTRQHIADAHRYMRETLDGEYRRMRALASVNPSIRKDELEHLRSLPEQLSAHLDRAGARLDAIRILVAG